MKLWNDRAVRAELICFGALTIAAALAGLLCSPWAALLLLLAGSGFTLLHILLLRRRTRALSELTETVDKLLHDPTLPPLAENAEGELAVLRSEIRKLTLRLRESTDLLAQDKRDLTDAIADISHQLRTPLTSMNLTVSLLRAPDLPEERRLALTRDLQKSLRRIDWLVETLLKLSKLDAGTAVFAKEPVAVSRLIQTATEPLLIAMDLRGQTLSVTAGDETFLGDAAWSAEALGNLVKNCVEHTPAGGTVFVEAAQTPIFTELVVRDTGPGFDPEDLPHLFERFYRGKNASPESIGIGLALARSIAAAQNGTLKAENDPAGGARFTLRFYRGTV